MTPLVKCLPCKHKDVLEPRIHLKSQTGQLETGGSLGPLAKQLSLLDKFQANKVPCLNNNSNNNNNNNKLDGP